MLAHKIEGAHVELGREQGFVPLHIRFEVTKDEGTGQMYPSMLAQFMPTAEELADLNAGNPITLRIIGIDWPPVALYTQDVLDPEAALMGVRYIQEIMRQRRADLQMQDDNNNDNSLEAVVARAKAKAADRGIEKLKHVPPAGIGEAEQG